MQKVKTKLLATKVRGTDTFYRCVKFNIICTFTVIPSPKDIEYIQELEHMKQIEEMQQQISIMENELSAMKLAQQINSQESNLKTSEPKEKNSQGSNSPEPEVKIEKDDSYYDYPSPVSMNSTLDYIPNPTQHFFHHHHPHHHHLHERNMEVMRKDSRHGFCGKSNQKRTIAKCKSIEATVTKEDQQPWTLTVKNGNMSIETHISSHAELMSHFEVMASTCLYQKSTSTLPFPFLHEPWAPKDAIGTALSIITWRKYDKSRFKSFTGYTPTLLHHDAALGVTEIASSGSIETITVRLVYTYINCLHVKKFFLHVPSFVRRFMMDGYVIQSPVVMALCSIICQQNCKHIAAIVPPEALNDYGLYYFEQARELISDHFDEATLETLYTFTFMAVHKIMTRDDTEGDRYLSIAERIYNLLLPQYKRQEETQSDESILFKRIYRCLHHSRSAISLHTILELKKISRSVIPRLSRLMEDLDDVDLQHAEDDTPREKKYIQVRHYVGQLRETIKHSIVTINAQDFPTFIGMFGHQVEMAMRHWYRNVLPLDFQLQIPLFEDTWTDIEFFTQLESECAESPIPILTTLTLYNEYLIMSKSYLPKNPDRTPPNTQELLIKFKQIQEHIHAHVGGEHDKMFHWFRMIQKMALLKRNYTGDTGDKDKMDDQEIMELIEAVNVSKIDFNMPFIHTSVVAALSMVRLFQFLLSRDYSCFLDLRWVMNAWQLLLRAARFKYQQPGDVEVTLDRIRANLILCLNIVRDQLKLSRRDSSGVFVDMMEQEFNSLF